MIRRKKLKTPKNRITAATHSYEAFYRENVPEEPPLNHRDKPPLIISELGVATMGIFP